MPKKKVAVALSDWLVDELDTEAASAGFSRSAMVEEAVAEYVTRRRAHARSTEFRANIQTALEDMEHFAAEYHADPETALEPSSLEKLRAIRAEGGGFAR